MAFRMKSAWISATIERGDQTFDLSVIQGLSGCLSGLNYTLKLGGASTVELTFNPTFEIAKDLIESGIFGAGFPAEDGGGSGGSAQLLSLVKGQLVGKLGKALGVNLSKLSSIKIPTSFAGAAALLKIKSASSEGASPDGPSMPTGTAVSLKVRWWYDDLDQDKRSISPTFFGIMMPPKITFGQEIAITIQASSTDAYNASTQDNKVTRQGETGAEIVESIASRLGVSLEWSGTSEKIASDRKFNIQQDMNSLLFLNELLGRMGLIAYFGSAPGVDDQKLTILSHFDINASKPVCELAMYKQIDPDGINGIPIYPLTHVDTDISFAFMTGLQRGSVSTTTNTKTKESIRSRNDVETMNRKVVGSTIGGKQQDGSSTLTGVKTGDAPDEEDSGLNNLGSNANDDNPDAFLDNQERVNDALEKAWKMHLTGPGIPWLLPGMLVKVDIGGIKNLTGNYKMVQLQHHIGEQGAESTYTVHKSLGFSKVSDFDKEENTNEPEKNSGNNATEKSATFAGGLIDKLKSFV